MITDILLAGLMLLAISLQKVYGAVPVRELKKRARAKDELAQLLYRAAGYGASLRVLLWGLVLASSAGFAVVFSRSTNPWLAAVVLAGLLAFGFIWLPSTRVTRFSAWIAARLSPVLAWLLNWLQPLISPVVEFVRRHRPVIVHTGVYDKQDLLSLLERQKVQADSRIDELELSIAKHALKFGDQLVADRMVPKRVVKSVSAAESVGPVLMDELHKSGHSRFPVYDGKKDNIVGILYLRDLVDVKNSQSVKNLMRKPVAYVHEEQVLYTALQAILKTHQQLLLVVNSFEEYVGVISMEDVLEAIIGRPIVDEFDQYEDLRAVAARLASKEHAQHPNQEAKEAPTTSSAEPEVPATSPESSAPAIGVE